MTDKTERAINLHQALCDEDGEYYTVSATFDMPAGNAFIDLGNGEQLILTREQLLDLLESLPEADEEADA